MNTGRRLLAEAIGTFFLVLIGPGTVMVDARIGGAIGPAGIALAFGFVVIAMINALGHLSGAHINPAVTVAFWSARRFPAADDVPYIMAQCAGATSASAVLRATIGPSAGWNVHWLYWVAPITGMTAAAQLYGALRSASAPPTRARSRLGAQGPV